jgi:2-succinyl-5-enolpyruvyl-6-hydroxy-3-cyclohexene-1-carboxylate synthase
LNTDKQHIQHLAAICRQKGVAYAVISPGSRCAPLIIAFNRMEGIDCISIIDERSAGFVALGIAQQTKQVVALICTSGSAILNYAPALAEAFYQKVPLLVLSADRPNEWIDQGENQSINQNEVYKNYIKKSYQLPLQINTEKDLWYSDRIVSEALNSCLYPDFGPVHINVPLREPLYNLVEDQFPKPKIIEFEKPSFTLTDQSFKALGDFWQKQSKILIVVGSHKERSITLENVLQQLSKQDNIIILKESISNVYGEDFIDQIDANVELITAHQLQNFTPDLVLTLGGGVVSKKIKFWLRSLPKLSHWHITKSFEHWDIFQSLSKVIQVDPVLFFEQLLAPSFIGVSTYKKDWQQLNKKTALALDQYLEKQEFTDFKIFDFLMKSIPQKSLIQLGNSTPIRYANLLHFEEKQDLQINSNRGVSGIDGVLSTAAGAAIAKPKQACYCITGDVAALYDSNALMNQKLKANYKLIIINNGGGNIFKIIPGPNKLDELEEFFETKHQVEFEHLAAMYQFKYFKAETTEELGAIFKSFTAEKEQCAVLEIKTDGEESANALRNYFFFLKESVSLD